MQGMKEMKQANLQWPPLRALREIDQARRL